MRIVISVLVLAAAVVLLKSFWKIKPMEVGLVRKRFSWGKNFGGSPIALNGEAGYQAELLTTGIRFKFWLLYTVEKHPMVQVPAGQIGVVIAQVGGAPPIGSKSGTYKSEFGNFEDLRTFMTKGGEKGVQRPVLPPGTVAAIHPVGFLVITKDAVLGVPVDDEYASKAKANNGKLSPNAFGLEPSQLEVLRIQPRTAEKDGAIIDQIGIVTTLEGTPAPSGAIATRLGDFKDVLDLEETVGTTPEALVEYVLAAQNSKHNSYQDFQKFMEAGGHIGLQHDPILYGAYNLNPFLVSVELVPMLTVKQGEVAVVTAYIGLPPKDVSGTEFKHGTLVVPGHRGIWSESLRPAKYPMNPRCYKTLIVPTAILTLNWANAQSHAHDLDKDLHPISAKSKEGFPFAIDLQVQIHVPHDRAPLVISTVGSMQNLVNEVLQAAVGNHFRDKLQSMGAVEFIQKRAEVQAAAETHVKEKLGQYWVETRGVYIQDVVLPEQIVKVLQDREIATQEVATLGEQKKAQDARIEVEASAGKAERQKDLAKSIVGIEIAGNDAEAVKKTTDGEAYRLTETGRAKAVETEAEGLAVAKGYEAQKKAIGEDGTTIVNVVKALSDKGQKLVPEVLVIGGGEGGMGGLAPMLMRLMQQKGGAVIPTATTGSIPVEAPAAVTPAPQANGHAPSA